MNLSHRNTHRSREEDQDPPPNEEAAGAIDGESDEDTGPRNKQGLKKEQWTRVVRAGEEHRGEIRLQPIVTDMICYHDNPPMAAKRGKTA